MSVDKKGGRRKLRVTTGGESPTMTIWRLFDAGGSGGNKEKKKKKRYEFFTFVMFA